MPSVTDVQQPILTSNNSGKSTPPPTATSIDTTNADPFIQALQVLEKKQRNLGKRKEKLEVYQQDEKAGKQLHKDQKEALAKYPEVLGQIECVKELTEQFKKIQTESTKNQKRLTKQAAEDKRQLISQRLREYTQLRYLLDHRPTTLKPEESTLLDQLSSVVIPSDNSSNSISRSVDFVSSIYQGGQASSSTIKTLTGKNPQEVRDILEELIKTSETPSSAPLPSPPVQEAVNEFIPTNDIQSSERNFIEHPLRFDTREQNIPLEQIIQDSPFLPDLNHPNQDQLPDTEQYLQTFTVVNSNINEQSSAVIDNQTKENLRNDEHQTDEQWQQQRGNGNARGQFNNGNRNYNRAANNYNQQPRRGPRGGWYDNSYAGNQRSYGENNRGRGGSNSNYRGNRGGNYRGGNRAYHNNVNGYQKPAYYSQTNEQYHQVRSAPPSGGQQ